MVTEPYRILIPNEVDLKLDGGYIIITTSKHRLRMKIPSSISRFEVINGLLYIEGDDISQVITLYSILQSIFAGLNLPYKVIVTSSATGTRFQKHNDRNYVKVGHSHFIELPSPEHCDIYILNQNRIELSSPVKQIATNTASRICNFKRPDVYKAKGLYIEGHEPRISKSIKK